MTQQHTFLQTRTFSNLSVLHCRRKDPIKCVSFPPHYRHLYSLTHRSALSSDSYGSIRNLGSMARGIRMANRDTTNNNINNSSFKSQSTDVLNKLSTTTSSNSASPSPLNSSSVIEPLALTSWKTSTRENKQQQDTKKRSVGGQQQIQRMNKIETGLYLGNLEAATDVIFIQSHGISHIVTLGIIHKEPLPFITSCIKS